jgi:uncharacterized protein (TIGR03086 family)
VQTEHERVNDLRRALDQSARVVAAVKPEQGDLPTPCEQWSVRDLLDHLISGLSVFRRMAIGEPRGEFRGGLSGDDWTGQYNARAAELLATWQELDRKGAVEGKAETTVGLTVMDVVIHGWDLAQATGQQPELDEDLGARVLAFARGFVRPEGRAATRGEVAGGVPLGPAVRVPDDAPVYTRLAAFLGRPS